MTSYRTPYRLRQSGLTLIEMLIAMMLGLFLLGGLFAILQSNKAAFTGQAQLSQLQDSQRFAMTVIGEATELAGYFPDPTTQLSGTVLPADTVFAAAGQPIAGLSGAGVTGDTFSVRYLTASGDGLLNCNGATNTSGAPLLYENTFSVNAAGQLLCSVNGAAPVPLVSGVQGLTVRYGVKSNVNSAVTTFDTYLPASALTAANWGNVVCLSVTVTFINPLAATAGQPATIPVTRVIAIMNRTGVNS